jgi:DNA primase
MRRALSLLLHHPGLAQEIDDIDGLREIPGAGTPILVEVLELLRARPQISMAGVLEHFRGTDAEAALRRLAAAELPATADFDPAAELRGVLRQLAGQRASARLAELADRARAGRLEPGERDEYLRLAAALAPGRRSRGKP